MLEGYLIQDGGVGLSAEVVAAFVNAIDSAANAIVLSCTPGAEMAGARHTPVLQDALRALPAEAFLPCLSQALTLTFTYIQCKFGTLQCNQCQSECK